MSIAYLNSFGQSKLDSLEGLIRTEKNPRKKVALLNAKTFLSIETDLEKANLASQRALEEAHRIGDEDGEGWAFAYRGIYFLLSGILTEAQTEFELGLSIAKKQHDFKLQAYCLVQEGNVMRDKGEFDSAKVFYNSAKSLCQENKEHYYRSVAHVNMARYYLIVHQPDSALRELKAALQIREQLKDAVLIADVWMLFGNCYRDKNDYNTAKEYYQKTLPMTRRDPSLEADYKLNMGELFFHEGDFIGALNNWNQVLVRYRKFQYKYALANLLLRMGSVFDQQGYFELATDYLTNALKISEKASYQYLVGQIIYEQAWVSYRSKNYEQALADRQKAEDVFRKAKSEAEIAGSWDLRGLIEKRKKNYDTALYYHLKSFNERKRLGNIVDIDASLFNIGEFYLNTEKFIKALPYYFKSLKMDEALGDNYGRSLNYNRIGKIYTQLAQYDSAKIYLDRSMKFAIPTSAKEIFRNNYLDLATLFEKKGQYVEANRYYKKYTQFTDSIFNKETAESLSAYRTLYDVERNEHQIELLNKDNKLKGTRSKTKDHSLFGHSRILHSFRFSDLLLSV